jgi:hypothetical protein
MSRAALHLLRAALHGRPPARVAADSPRFLSIASVEREGLAEIIDHDASARIQKGEGAANPALSTLQTATVGVHPQTFPPTS